MSNEIGLDGIQVEKESVTRGRFFTVASSRTQKERETREGSLSGWRKIRGWKQSARWMALFAWHPRKTFVLCESCSSKLVKISTRTPLPGPLVIPGLFLCLPVRIEQTRSLRRRNSVMVFVKSLDCKVNAFLMFQMSCSSQFHRNIYVRRFGKVNLDVSQYFLEYLSDRCRVSFIWYISIIIVFIVNYRLS